MKAKGTSFPIGLLRCGVSTGYKRYVLAAAVGMLNLFVLGTGVAAEARIDDMYRINKGAFNTHVDYKLIELEPGKEMVLGDLSGPGKVTYFYITDSSQGSIYGGLVLKIYWDNASEPSIQMPLSDFFGAFASKSIDYQSLLMQINHYCYMSYLPMPFSKRARFVLLNDGDKPYSQAVAWGIDYEKNPDFADETSRLHAAWRRSNPVENGVHPMLEITGKGQYIGNFLQVNANEVGWFGEGDTIFEVDGKKMTHSPGTEDEYGSAWGFDRTFSYPNSGYIQMDSRSNRMYRWYVANPVRFQKSLSVMIQNQRIYKEKFKNFDEAFKAQEPGKDDYTSVVYWYQEGAHPAPALLAYADRVATSRRPDGPKAAVNLD